jgi:serine protease Do
VIENIQLIENIERYLSGEMSEAEKIIFEELRRTDTSMDQLTVEHTIFLKELSSFKDKKHFRHNLLQAHQQLVEDGSIKEEFTSGKVFAIFRKYTKVLSVAASIAGIIALTISGLVAYLTPRANTSQLELLSKVNARVSALEQKQNTISNQIAGNTKAPANLPVKTNGTGFLLDTKGFLITNAHVIKNDKLLAQTIIVQNNKGQEYKVKVLHVDDARDLAVLKIDDEDFKSLPALPYGLKKMGAELGEEIFTLGFPRSEIVYGEGYMSAATGFNGDTLSCQIAIAANPGNSGGPVFNKNGEVIGILSTRQMETQGFVFAVTTKNIFRLYDELKKDITYERLKINTHSSIKGLDRTLQIKKVQDYVFLVKTY